MKEQIIRWVQVWFRHKPMKNAIIGLSGGKDSTVAARVLVEALGPDCVYGISLPYKTPTEAKEVADYLGLTKNHHFYETSIDAIVNTAINSLKYGLGKDTLTDVSLINLPARLRMSILYGFAQNLKGYVCNTCNCSEDFVGYSTRWGDDVGDFALLKELTYTDVLLLGEELGVPVKFLNKPPDDGLCGQTDEERFGFTYQELDDYIMYGILPENNDSLTKIETMHKNSAFKRKYDIMDYFYP